MQVLTFARARMHVCYSLRSSARMTRAECIRTAVTINYAAYKCTAG